tara:strand:- start:477 stop:1658 length:1182 start_codon:yes stop_codon:yes gene_type:complete
MLNKRKIKILNNCPEIEWEIIAPHIVQRFIKNNQEEIIAKEYWARIKHYLTLPEKVKKQYFSSLLNNLFQSKSFISRHNKKAVEILLEDYASIDLDLPSFRKYFLEVTKNKEAINKIWEYLGAEHAKENLDNHPHLQTCIKESSITNLIIEQQDFEDIEIKSLLQIKAMKAFIKNKKNKKMINELVPLSLNNNQEISQIVLGLIEEHIRDTKIFLQLIESSMPRAIETAENFFKELNPSSDDYYKTVLLLCDSPYENAQLFGLKLIKQNISYLPKSSLLRNLSETRNKLIQQYLANEISNLLSDKDEFLNFEADILRTRNQKRKLKELIKKRIEKAIEDNVSSNLDQKYLAPLVSLTLGLVKEDSAWAIRNLTSLSIHGYEIKDLAITTPIKP